MNSSNNVCGVGGWTGPLSGDPDNNLVLAATSAYGGIDVSWSYPSVNPHAVAYVILYRGLTDIFAEAIQISIVSGSYFFDRVSAEEAQEYFYWIKVVSINGTTGALIGPASATARPSIEETLTQLTGKIDQGVLAEALKSELGKIATLGGSLSQEVRNRIEENLVITDSVAQVQGGIDAAHQLLFEETNTRVTQHQALVSSLNLMGVKLDSSVAGLSEQIDLVAGPDSALAQKVTTLEATVDGNTATGEVGLTAKVDDVTGAVESMYVAKVGSNGLVGGFGLYNDGASVEAGFDVDKFWIGSSSTDATKPFIVEDGKVYMDSAIVKKLTADQIDTTNLTVRDASGKILFGAGTNLGWEYVTGPNKPDDGATRNVYVGAWSTGTQYNVGDIVVDTQGYGWSAIVPHTSSATVTTPKYPETRNAFWALHTVKGEAGQAATTQWLTSSATTIGRTAAGIYVNASVTFKANQKTGDSLSSPYFGYFLIETTVDGSEYEVAYSSTEEETGVQFTLPEKIKMIRVRLYPELSSPALDELSVAIVDDAVGYTVKIESTNGTVFRVGQSKRTYLYARVFRNGEEVTNEIPSSSFRWRRVSLVPNPADSDELWNSTYLYGYKQVEVSVDSIYAKASFFCDIFMS